MSRILLPLLMTALLGACASNHVITGTPRPAIDPAQVRIYFAPPPNGYEEIALLQSNSGSFTFGEQAKMDSVIAKLRVEAGRLGANGVLFQGTEDGYGNSGVSIGAGGGRSSRGGSGFSAGGVGISLSPQQKFARGVAVYVANPPPLDAPRPPPPPPSAYGPVSPPPPAPPPPRN